MSNEAAMEQALATGDIPEVVRLYIGAADVAEQRGDIDETCFYLTQAWVLALQYDLDHRLVIEQRLSAHHRL